MVVEENGKFGFYDGKLSGKINSINGTVTDKSEGYDAVTSTEEEYEVSVLRKTFVVTFDANGGTASFNSKIVIFNRAYGELPTAERTGYTFAGWSTSAETDDFITQLTIVEIEDNHTITAKWTPNNYNIAYNNNTGIGEIENTVCTYDTEVMIATPTEGTITKTGYTFKNWNTKPDGTGTTYEPGEIVKNLSNIDNETITLYATWQDTIAPSKTAPTGVGTTNSITVNCKQTDDGSGIDSTTIEYAIYKDGAWSEWQSSNIFQELIKNTEYQVKTRVTDNSGNGPVESEVGLISTTVITNGTIVIHKENASGEEVELNTDKENNSKQINTNIHITATISTVENTNTTVTVKNTEQENTYPNTTILPNEQGIIEIPVETETDTYEITIQTTDGTNTLSDTYYVFIDKTLPTANPDIQSTTNSLTILANAEDTNSGVGIVTYELKQGETILQTNNTGVFEGLQHNTDYEIVINVTDKAGNSNSSTRTAKTDELVVGDLAFKKNVSQVEFLPATTNQEKVWLNEDLLVTINQATSGNTTYKVQKVGEDEFVEYAQDRLITVEDGDYIITVVTTDGTNNVSKEYYFTVDKTAPEINTYIVASLDDITDSSTIIESTEITQSKYIVTVAKDESSGIVAYALNNNNTEEPVYTEIATTAEILEKSEELTKNGSYYVYVKDQAGNIGVKEVNINNIGYTVQYNLNGGTSEKEIQNQVKLQGTNLTLTNIKPSKEGYIFKGWATAQDATEAEYSLNGIYMKDEETTLYAVWSEAVASATIGEDVTYYESVQDAINSARSNTATITLIKSEIVESITVVAGQNIILNVNGSTLRNEEEKPTIDNYGTLTINSGSIISTQNVAISNSGTLTLGDSSNDVDTSTPVIIGKTYGISGENTGTIEFYDGIVKGQSGEGSAINGTVGTVARRYELYKTVETVDDVVVESARLARVAVFDTGGRVNVRMKKLSGTANVTDYTSDSNIQYIKESDVEPDISAMTSANIVSSLTSDVPIYMWYEDGTIYWWSEAEIVKANSNSMRMFYNCRSLSDITGISSWDTSNVTDMGEMFNWCSNLSDLTGLSSWDTSNVTSMYGMFNNCNAVSDITGLSSWDTSNVTSMHYMFYNCSSLSDITGLSSWDTGSVRNNMESMFYGCSSLSDLTGISSWNTSNVTNMSNMFYGCSSLSDLTGISNWNTSNVTNMSNMFYGCSSLSDLTGISNWNTSNVTNMSYMFNWCSSLSDLTGISSWNTSNVTNMSNMFRNCRNLSDITALSSWDTSNVTSMSEMFSGCRNLSDLTGISSWDTSNVTNMGGMFSGCSSLSDLTGISSWDTSSVTKMYGMFSGCSSLSDLTGISSWDTSSVTEMSSTFSGCSSLSDLTGISSWDTSSVTYMGSMFSKCSNLSDLTGISSWDTSSVTYMSYMFYGCSSLSDLTGISSWDTSSVTNMSYMFYGCSSLSDLTRISSWDTSSVTNMSDMFYECTAITDATGINDWNIANVTNFNYMFMFCHVTTYPNWNGTWDSNGTFKPGETTESQVSAASLETEEVVSATENTSVELMTYGMDEVEETTQTTETTDVTEVIDDTETTQVTPLIQIGTTTYSTIADAITAANSGETLELLDNITLTEELVIPENKSINLDLNSKTITSSLVNTIINKGTLTITSTGIIRNEIENGSVIYNTGTLNIQNGTITTSTNGGKAVYNDSGVVSMTSGKIVTEGISGIGIYNVNNAKVNMQGGIIEVTGTSNKCIYNDSILEITGGKIIVSGDDSIGIYNLDKATNCTMKDVEILVEAEVIENYNLIKNTNEFKSELEKMKPSYGIYNDSEIDVNIEKATIKVERLKGVGILNNSIGSIVLGKNDETLNLATPIIYAISDNTTAIINTKAPSADSADSVTTKEKYGNIKFYDGTMSTLVSIKDVVTVILDKHEIVENKGNSVINTILKIIEKQ